MVLRAVEPGAEAADLLDQRPPQHRQVGAVVLRAQSLRRPVRLVERVVDRAVGGDLVLVGVDVVDVRVGVERGGDERQGVGLDAVVVVDEHDELAGRHRQGVVRRGDDAAGVGPGAQVHPSDRRRPPRARRARPDRSSRRRPGTAPSRRTSDRRSSGAPAAGATRAGRARARGSRTAASSPANDAADAPQHRLDSLAARRPPPHDQLEPLHLPAQLTELVLEGAGVGDRLVALADEHGDLVVVGHAATGRVRARPPCASSTSPPTTRRTSSAAPPCRSNGWPRGAVRGRPRRRRALRRDPGRARRRRGARRAARRCRRALDRHRRSRIEQDIDANWRNPAATDAAASLLDSWRPDVVHAHALQTLGAELARRAADTGVPDVRHDARPVVVVPSPVPRRPVDASVPARHPHERPARAPGTPSGATARAAALDPVLAPCRPGPRPVARAARRRRRQRAGTRSRRRRRERRRRSPTPGPGGPCGTTTGPVRFVYVGGDSPLKGRDVVLAAARSLRRLGGWQLTLPGVDRPGWATTVRLRHVTFAPAVPLGGHGDVMASADVLVIPSIARESYSLAAREALAAGLAVDHAATASGRWRSSSTSATGSSCRPATSTRWRRRCGGWSRIVTCCAGCEPGHWSTRPRLRDTGRARRDRLIDRYRSAGAE